MNYITVRKRGDLLGAMKGLASVVPSLDLRQRHVLLTCGGGSHLSDGELLDAAVHMEDHGYEVTL